MQKTIGQPIPAWKVFGISTNPLDISVLMDGYNEFEIDPFKAVRMVARAMPNFVLNIRELAEAAFTPLYTEQTHFNVDMLKDEKPIRTLKEGERFLLCSLMVRDESENWHYRLYAQKVTAQPHYRVYIQE